MHEAASQQEGPLGHESAPLRPPRVLMLVDALARNGAIKLSMELARRWAPDGARLGVLLHPENMFSFEPEPSVPVYDLAWGAKRLRWGLPLSAPRLAAATAKSQLVVACSEIGVTTLLGFASARALGRRIVVAVHAEPEQALREWMPSWLHPLFRYVYRHCDGVVCVAPELGKSMLSLGLVASRVRVVVNGIDIAATRRAAQESPSVVSAGPPFVVATGRLSRQKGYDVLLRAHARVVRGQPHRLCILNDGPELGRLQQLAVELGVAGSVQFHGKVLHPLPTVAAASVFCLPSRHEGLPLALLEALALGVPCIATTSSEGVSAALAGGAAGELVPVDDENALALALERHLQNPAPLRLRAAHGQEHIRSYDSAVMAQEWAAALHDFARS